MFYVVKDVLNLKCALSLIIHPQLPELPGIVKIVERYCVPIRFGTRHRHSGKRDIFFITHANCIIV